MKAVVLDGYGINPGDLSWDELEKLADVTVYERTAPEEVYERVKDCDAILLNKVELDAEMINRLPKLKYIGVLATGYNIVDIEAAAKRGIPVCNIPAYSSDSVAQLAISMMLNFCWHVTEHSEEIHKGKWTKSKDFAYKSFELHELNGKTLGIVGFGSIGQKVAAIAKTMGMNIIFHNRSVKNCDFAKQVSLDEVLGKSDFISLHAPLNQDSKNIINEESLKKVKKTAVIINTARGPLIDEKAVAKALKSGDLAGYATDVLSKEPPKDGSPLFGCPNCYITPHIAWQTTEARIRLMDILVDNFKGFVNGEIKNKVN